MKLAAQPAAASWLPMLLGTLARLDLAEGHPEAAVRDVEAAFAKSDNAGTDQSYRPIHLSAYRAYRLTHNFEQALIHLEAFNQLDAAGRTLATSTSSALMAARFDFANQNARIATLKTGQLVRDVALARLQARQSRLILGGLLVLVTVAAGFLFVYLRALRRNRNEVVAANLALAATNADLAEALLAKSQFLATTSHEIRTPLNGILGMTQVMLADRSIGGAVRERISLVDSAGRSMRSLVDDILDFAKMDSGVLTINAVSVDLALLLPEVVALWRVEATDKGIALDLDLAGIDAAVVTDAVRLRQVVFNLLSNAVKFTAVGAVAVSAFREMVAGSEQLVIAVSDSGIGIPAEAFETIFESFRQLDTTTTRRFGGTGLGLAISRNIAQALGGTITVASVIGAGSTFNLRVPYVPAGPGQGVPATTSARNPGDLPRLLVISSNPISRSLLRARLEPSFDRCTACDSAATTASLATDRVDVVLIDADNIADEALDALVTRAAATGVPVAILGGASILERSTILHAAGAGVVLSKPLATDILVAKLLASVTASVRESSSEMS